MKFRITNENIEGYNTELKIRRMNYDQVVVNYQNNSGIKTFKINEGELVSEGEVDDIIKKYTDLLKIKINRDFSKKTDEFSEILAKEIEKQDRFLKLFSILYTNLEKNASEEKLIQFKEDLNYCQIKFIKIIKTTFPSLEEVQIRKFLEILSCFIIGFYPLVSPNDIQKEALKKAKIGYYPPSFKKVLREQIISTLRNVIYHSGEKVSSIPYRLIW